MPTYNYTGKTAHGDVLEGTVQAFDEMEAMQEARQHVEIVNSVTKVRETPGFLNVNITDPKVKPRDLAVLSSQFAIILRAGMPIARAVELVSEQVDDKYLKQVLADAAGDVASGHGLADSFQDKGEYLPAVFIETIRAGEEGGRLPESFDRLKDYFDRRSKVGGKIAAAVTYPIFVLCIAVVVLALMMVMVVPTIAGMVESLGAEMPAMTVFLIGVSDFFGDNILLILVVLAMIVIAIRSWAKTENGKMALSRFALRVPVIGRVNVCSCAGQFANTMCTLISAGLPVTRAVATTSRVFSNQAVASEVEAMVVGLEEGRGLGECMTGSEYMPHTLIEMTAIGESTGELEETLDVMGKFYDEETARLTDRALSLLEPILLVFLAIFAGFIVIALYLPLFTMYASM